MFKIDNWGSDTSNAKGMMAGQRYYRYFNEENNDITASGYFPANLCLEKGDRIVVIPSDTDNSDELYVVTAVSAGVATIAKATSASGGVTSVNGKTGAVVLGAEDVDAVPQYSTMPTASADNLGEIVQFTGTTDANYTNGYFYKCTAAGEPAVYSWTQANVQPAPSGLPDQTGQSGKFLTTDGTDASWATVNALQNTATGTDSLTIMGTPTSNTYTINIGAQSSSSGDGVAIGWKAQGSGGGSIAIGKQAKTSGMGSVAIGQSAEVQKNYGVAIGVEAKTTAYGAIQIASIYGCTNSDAHTFKVGTPNGNFELMNANGNLPAARLASTTGLADGNYRLRLTIASGVATLSWVAE